MPIPKNVTKEYFVQPVDHFFIQENIIDDDESFINTPIFEHSFFDIQFSFFNEPDYFYDEPINFIDDELFYFDDEPINFIDDELFYPIAFEPNCPSFHIIIADSSELSDCEFFKRFTYSTKLHLHYLYVKEKHKNQIRWKTESRTIEQYLSRTSVE